jgi:hypothetical protein
VWSWAIAAPAARSRSVGHSAGQALEPVMTGSTVAGVPVARPSRSAPGRRGAGKLCCSATASAAAFVAIIWGPVRLLGDRRTTANGDLAAVLRSIHSRSRHHAWNALLLLRRHRPPAQQPTQAPAETGQRCPAQSSRTGRLCANDG